MKKRGSSFAMFLVFIMIILGIFWYIDHTQLTEKVQSLERMPVLQGEQITVADLKELIIQQQEGEISQYVQDLVEKDVEISVLQLKVEELEQELSKTKSELSSTKIQLEQCKATVCEEPEEEPEVQVFEPNKLLWNIRQNAQQEILDHIGLDRPVQPANDDERWGRAELVYEWIKSNFEFCKKESEHFTDFNFASPDDLVDPEKDEWCGDVNDFAMLYAGMMYASGVSEHNLIVACGDNHCWNLLIKRDKPYEGWYIIDSACTQAYYVAQHYDSSSLKRTFPGFWQRVTCFEDYTAEATFGPYFYKEE